MGLDMFLFRKTHIWSDKRENIQIIGIPGIQLDRVSKITEEVGYWRKANQIHKWFVENVQDGNDDCRSYYVPKEKLSELLDIVNRVLENKELGRTLLPTQGGFFFGSTNYDNYYIEDLKNTKEILTKILADINDNYKGFSVSYYYRSSW